MPLHKYSYSALLISAGLFFSYCNSAKYILANDTLYTGAKIQIDSSILSHREKKKLKTNLLSITRPKTNSKILGLRIKLWIYNLAGKPKKKKSIRSWVKDKFGEPPVLASSLDLERNSKILQSYLQNKGYFQALVDGDTTTSHKKTEAKYRAQLFEVYRIQSVTLVRDSSAENKAIAADFSETLLKKGNPFDLDLIRAERDRIDADLKENGFYFFSPDFLIVQVDSNLRSHQVNMYVKVKPGIPIEAQHPYDIKDVFIYANYTLDGPARDTSKKNAIEYNKFYLIDSGRLYNPRMFDDALKFQPGDTYTRSDHNISLSRLINLGLFKFVKNRFEIAPSADSPALNTFYYLTPLPKKSIHGEFVGVSKSDNLVGSQVTLGWKNRNTFKGGELFSIDTYGGFEVQYSSDETGYNTYRTGIGTKLAFPRFIVPFFKLNTNSAFVPKTNIELGYDFLNKIRLYTLNSFRASFGYDWKESIRKEHQLNPISIIYVQPLNVTKEYIDSALINPTLLLAIQKQFILGSNYNFTFNQLVGKRPPNAFYFNGNIDLSGNIAGLLTGANSRAGKTVYLFNLDFSQYIRGETDFRFYHTEGSTIWANRIDLGFGYPYGNSTALPFVKQFFVGGTNSVRAFRSRSVGPGTYVPPYANNFLPDQSGDIKLELNTELRAHLFSIVNGAIFVDAGNVWLYNDDPLKPGGKFTGEFLQQLAVGTGMGLRFDVSILVIRVDLAFPLRRPWLPDNQRWVINQIAFGNGNWRSENLVFNFGIGYPF
jgi:outer membrane protein insertion porin family